VDRAAELPGDPQSRQGVRAKVGRARAGPEGAERGSSGKRPRPTRTRFLARDAGLL